MKKNFKNNAFLVEEHRNKIAKDGNLEDLEKLYAPEYASHKDINSPEMWNFHIENHGVKQSKNKITIARINQTVNIFPPEVKNVLDIGIGYGFVTKKIHHKYPKMKIHGTDISKFAIENIAKEIDGEFKIGSLREIPWEENSFEAILLLETLEHIPANEVFNCLKEIKRVLKSGGYLVMSVPLHENLRASTFKCPCCHELINSNGHVRSYTPELITKELKIAGFEIVEKKAIWAYRILNWLNIFEIPKLNKKCGNIVIKARLK